ncbi:MAG: carboxypeptidase-like regulatory domain-containing protein [Chitinophagaceae bacterium]
MGNFKQLLMLLIVVCFSQLLKANNGENGEKKSIEVCVHGYVMDAVTRKPVTGVTVSVSSGKIRAGKEIQSDAAGCFTFAKLPPGNVTLMFEKKGYKLFKRDLVSVKEGTVTKISVDFQPVEDGGNEMWHPLLKLLD